VPASPLDQPIAAVCFDFGGVICSSPFEAFAHYEQSHGLPPGFLRRLNARNPDGNAWARLERAEVEIEEFRILFEEEARAEGYEVDALEVLGLLGGELRPRMVRAVRRLRGSVKTALLTNNFALTDPVALAARFGARSAEVAALLDDFDLVLESSKVGLRKPEMRYYELALELLGVPAAHTVFLDDLGINLKPARALGMHTIKVESEEQALAELGALVGLDLLDDAA
jgi:putative hydrolase of the HAD superfamily